MDGEHTGKATISRIGQLCKVTTLTEAFPSCLKKFIIFFLLLSSANISDSELLFVRSASSERHGRPQESGEQVDHFPQGPPPVLGPRGQRHRHALR